MKPPADPKKNSRDLARIVTWGAALSMGATAALVASIKRINPTIEFKFSVATVVAFLGAGFFTVTFFQKLLGAGRSASMEGHLPSPKERRRLIVYCLASVVVTFAAMGYGLRNVSQEKQFDVVVGAAIAIAVLTFVGWLGSRVVRFLEADEKQGDQLPPK
jgi:hypothetical protein